MSDDRSRTEVTRLLAAVRAGDRLALDELYALVYQELRLLAHRQRKRWEQTGTLNTTALVHEAYLKLVHQPRLAVSTPEHFLALAATAIRHIISNHARDRRTRKRGGDVCTVALTTLRAEPRGLLPVSDGSLDLLIAIDDALDRLDRISPRQRGIVECRFYGGMTTEETAAALGISATTVKRDWVLAQTWLYRELRDRV
ncbi:ECF-type sigma factor [Luteitalea pratensis]|nr:ECF-type sigma factor [Luteitalea pratensis]